MKCNQTKELLSAYIDEMLDPVARKNLELHLSSCHGCTEELLTLKKYLSKVNSLRPVKAPDDFLEKVNDRIKRRFEFEKIMHTLLMPAKIKIPLETAGVLLTVVFVVIIYKIISPGINYPAPAKNLSLEQDKAQISRIVKKNTAKPQITAPIPAEKNKETSQATEAMNTDRHLLDSYEQESTAIQPQQKQLDMETVSMREMGESSSAEKSEAFTENQKFWAAAGAEKSYDLFINILEKDLTLDEASNKVNSIAKSESGIVVFMPTAQDGQSRIIILSMPAKNYDSLLNKLQAVGKVQYQLLNFKTDSNESLNLRIHLILSQ